MHRTALGTITAALTTSLVGSALLTLSPTAAGAATTTHPERGLVVECTGKVAGQHVAVSLYENSRYGNELQVVFDHGDGPGKGRSQEAKLVRAGHVDTTIRVAQQAVRITGTAIRTQHVKRVRSTHEDTTAVGTHRRLSTDLEVTYRERTAPLDCDTAFRYRLQVTHAG
ncbi:MAG TPA: hypothetical protein VGE38_10380 [Nocardioides sp.]|uniref:hypothetical protein n=1 Tax=Nocardioides sp. TaxID=35761 RepID=UPI002ED81CDA